MADYEFTYTDDGIIGILPCGERRDFANEAEYRKAYTDEENEFVDEMARLHGWDDEVLDIPDHYWLEFA